MSRIAIVTGGGSGIGRALCEAIVQRGAHVVVADLDGDAAEKVAKRLQERGPGSAEPAELDVADADAVAELVTSVHRDHGRLDFMFNNAGVAVGGPPEELTLAHWERALDVNLRGVIHGCHAAHPLMVEQGFGHIVNTASVAGLIPNPGSMGPYAMTKHGVVGLSLAWRAAAADHGVKVHVVCPGVIDTPILDKTEFEGLPTPPSQVGLDIRRSFREAGLRRFYPPARLAEDVLAGIARDKAVIAAPAEAKVLWWLARLAPGLARRLALHSTRRTREQSEQRSAATTD